jgi:hypothetical protein
VDHASIVGSGIVAANTVYRASRSLTADHGIDDSRNKALTSLRAGKSAGNDAGDTMGTFTSAPYTMNNRKTPGHRRGLGGSRRLTSIGDGTALLIAMGLRGMHGSRTGVIVYRAGKFTRMMTRHLSIIRGYIF